MPGISQIAARPNAAALSTSQVPPFERFAEAARALWGSEVRIAAGKPDPNDPGPIVWQSSRRPGAIGVRSPGHADKRASSLESAERLLADRGILSKSLFQQEVQQRWGSRITVGRPSGGDQSIAIWRSTTHPGTLKVRLPGRSDAAVANLEEAERLLGSHGILSRRALTLQTIERWGSQVGTQPPASPALNPAANRQPAVWMAEDGGIALFIPHLGVRKEATLDQAEKALASHGIFSPASFRAAVHLRWSGTVMALDSRPKSPPAGNAIWPSKSHPGSFTVQLEDGSKRTIARLDEGDRLFGIRGRISDGSGVEVSAPMLTREERHALGSQHGVRVAPIAVNGKELAYLFRVSGSSNASLVLSCHGDAQSALSYVKPSGLEMRFVARDNTILLTNTLAFMKHLSTAGLGNYTPGGAGQIYASPRRHAADYMVTGAIRTSPQALAAQMAKVAGSTARQPYDVVLLNARAQGVHLST